MSIKRLFCAAEYAEIDRLRCELASTVAQLRIAELTAARNSSFTIMKRNSRKTQSRRIKSRFHITNSGR